MSQEYKCICGRIFTNSQAFNGHRSHCEVYLTPLGKFDSRKQARATGAAKARAVYIKQLEAARNTELTIWISEQHKCEKCGKIMTEKFGSGRFCSRACANSREHSEETKQKISDTYKSHVAMCANFKQNSTVYFTAVHDRAVAKYTNNPKYCSICNKQLPFELRFRKTCSDACLYIAFINAGRIAASRLEKRSKNEIAFCELCEEYFGKGTVLHNEPIFNGWDADIIIPQYKLAILWNGPWHYRKVTKSHNLAQVQTRDKIKIDQIEVCGFIPYIIKDTSKYNLNKVNSEFNKLIEYIENL